MLGPFSLALIALLSAGIIDTIYLARLSSPDNPNLGIMALAAMGFAYPLTFLGNSANIGLGAGTLSAVSRALGQNDPQRAHRHGAAAILLGVSVMSMLVILMWLLMPFTLRMMGAEGEIKRMAFAYLTISLPGLVVVCVPMMCSNVLRAHGEAVLPSTIMILGAVLNIIIDPFLIFGLGPFPRMEVEGAALATVIGNCIAAAYGFHGVKVRRGVVNFAEMTFKSLKRAWKTIGRVGLPAALTNIIVPLSVAVAVGIIANKLTVEDVAAFTLAGRAELFAVGVLYALSACIGALTGQNGGAKLTPRVRQTFKICYTICIVWGTLMAIIMAVFAAQIAGMFTPDAVLIEKATTYFYIVPVTIFAYGFVFVSAAGFNALGRPRYGLIFTVLRSLLLYISFVYIGVNMAGLMGAFIGIAAANLIAGLFAAGWSLYRAPMTAKLH